MGARVLNKSDSERLAIDGGGALRTESFAPWPHYAQDEIDAVTRILQSGKVNYWTGTEGRAFEKEYAAHTGCRHAIALANGTAALELALYALGIGPGDEVVVPSRTFIASASCAVMRGATPVVAEVDPVSQSVSKTPTAATGTESMTTSGSRSDSYCEAKTM